MTTPNNNFFFIYVLIRHDSYREVKFGQIDVRTKTKLIGWYHSFPATTMTISPLTVFSLK